MAARGEFMAKLRDHGLALSALNCSGNPLHPGELGRQHQEVTSKTIRLAGMLGVESARQFLERSYRFISGASLGQAGESQSEEVDRRRHLFRETMSEARLWLGEGQNRRQLAVDQQPAQEKHPRLRICSDAEQLLVVP